MISSAQIRKILVERVRKHRIYSRRLGVVQRTCCPFCGIQRVVWKNHLKDCKELTNTVDEILDNIEVTDHATR